MNRIILSVVFLQSLLVSSAFTQWVELTSGTTSNLKAVHFPAYDTGFVVGENGTILKTTDNGESWISLSAGLSVQLRGVYFTNAQIGYVVGDSGIIIKTTNGGSSWYIVHRSLEWLPHLYSVFFTDSLHGYVAGFTETLLKTTDAGEHWEQSVISTTLHENIQGPYKVHFPSPDTGYASYTGGIFRTTDAGSHWHQIADVSTDSTFPFSILYGCQFTSSTTGFIAGWYLGTLAKTTDGGFHWTTLDDSVTLFSLCFPEPAIGYAVGYIISNGDTGSVFKTIDGGNTWEVQKISHLGNSNYSRSMYFVDADCGFIVGLAGKIFRTRNGGVTSMQWSQSDIPSFIELSQNFPNPFNPSTTIRFTIPKASFVSLRIYDLLGREIAVLANGEFAAGACDIKWDALKNASGIYFYRLMVGNFVMTKKLIFAK